MKGSGEVPQDELGPALECEDEGELDAVPPTLKLAESRLDLDALPLMSYGEPLNTPGNLTAASRDWLSEWSRPLDETDAA